jgi:outer membrane protein assembly factor BamB
MRNRLLAKWLPVGVSVLAVAALVFWYASHRPDLRERLPGADSAEGGTGGSGATKWDGKLVKGHGTPSDLPGNWPRFRGPDGDNISKETTPPLAKAWPPDGPKVRWKTPVGEGFAGATIFKGRVYLIDYDREGQADALRCLSLADGQEIWRYTYSVKVKRNHGMSRTIPAINDQVAVALGPKCHLICVDPMSGELKWKVDLVKEFNVEVPPWYAGQCPLLEGDRLVVGTGGDALVVAFEAATGKVIWKSPNPNKWQMTHSSVAPMEFNGKKMYVYCGSGGVAGVSADDGQILWQTPDWKISIANIPTPLAVGDGRIFLSGGYNAGSMMIQLKEADGKYSVQTLFRLKPAVFGSVQQTPILYQNHIFGVRPDGQLVCLDLSGKSVWESGPANRFGSAPYIVVQGMIYVLDDDGTLTLAEASTTGYKQLARAKVLQGPDAWGPMALAGGLLLVRDLNQLECLDVSAK